MREALEALNRLVADGIIEDYAVGGAIGASFYIKAAQTEDVDAFVFLPQSSLGLVTLSPIYEALVALGGVVQGEHIRFGNWPVQILSDANSLISEAIKFAISVNYDKVPTRIFSAQHLCAIALQTGRSKDYLRVKMFLEQGAVDVEALSSIVERFDLSERLGKIPR